MHSALCYIIPNSAFPLPNSNICHPTSVETMREDIIMLVKNWMSKPAITIDADSSLKDAIWLLKQLKITMCPVMKFGLLVGIVTDRDLKRVSPSDVPSFEMYELVELISRVKVKTVMTENPVTIPCDYTVEEAAGLKSGQFNRKRNFDLAEFIKKANIES